MKLPFLNRVAEMKRLQRFAARSPGSLAVLYGRRRCGKSRLLLEVLDRQKLVYFLADDREAGLQIAALATAMSPMLPGFDGVRYPGWDALLARWAAEAPAGAILVLDELPALVARSPELPSLLQRRVDQLPNAHLVLCGSSQRLMQGLALDRTAPLFGRATELMKIRPLAPGWVVPALATRSGASAVEAYAVWGGVPRYWELARDFSTLEEAVEALVLDTLGVLHEEPTALLLDDLRDTAQSASILQLVGNGCSRLSEIASRLDKPAGALVRPMQRLLDLELIHKEQPFGASPRDAKRTLYTIADPFLCFWFRFVGPHRSWLGERLFRQVQDRIRATFPGYVGAMWEKLAIQSVPWLNLYGDVWGPAARWWGNGLDRKPMEVDVVALSADESSILLGSVKWEARADVARWSAELKEQAQRFPLAEGRKIRLALWHRQCHKAEIRNEVALVGPDAVMSALQN